MKLSTAILFALVFALPAHAGKPKACGDDKPAEPPPNPTPAPTANKHKDRDGKALLFGVGLAAGAVLTCNLTDWCKVQPVITKEE
jgi:hypothetical protein